MYRDDKLAWTFVIFWVLLFSGTMVLTYHGAEAEYAKDEQVTDEYRIERMENYDNCMNGSNVTNIMEACLYYYDIPLYMQYDRDLFEISVHDDADDLLEEMHSESETIWLLGIIVGLILGAIISAIITYAIIETIWDKIERFKWRREKAKKYCPKCGNRF